MTVITVYNAKGGCGKTTTAVNLAAAFNKLGFRVLLLDLDWQGSASTSLGLSPRNIEVSIADAIAEQIVSPETASEVVDIATHYLEHEGFSIIPANAKLNKSEFRNVIGDGSAMDIIIPALHDLLEGLEYDYVLIDTPPAVDNLLYMSLFASDSVIIPTEAEFLSLDALGNMLETFYVFKQNIKPELDILGILLNKVSKNKYAQAIEEETRSFADSNNLRCFSTVIPRSIVAGSSSIIGSSVISKIGFSRIKQAYIELAQEIIG